MNTYDNPYETGTREAPALRFSLGPESERLEWQTTKWSTWTT
jgi:hypothetical protein